jgi:hypothetical protein
MKETLIVGASAALGGWIVTKYGAPIEAQAVKFHIPVTIAHMAVVGGSAALVFFVLTKVV